jgi:hypothetical protein
MAKNEVPANEPGPLDQLVFKLGSAALSLVLFFFILALAALFLLILLAGLLATLTGLASLLALTRLSALTTLLFVFLHIVCHENSPPFACASWRTS